jgi:hypothetical protein
MENNMKKIRLGLIGLSQGNGHPYSWGAIINGYDPILMEECPFPVIPRYLENEVFPEAKIRDAEITHLWTQDMALSEHIAKTTYIPQIVSDMKDMIPYVDAVLLARDDAENHVAMAKPFLAAGLPIYIDKPLALMCSEVELLFSLQQYEGQLFTCSAFTYARELKNVKTILDKTPILKVEAYIKNDWNKYAIHLIEPIISVIGSECYIKSINSYSNKLELLVTYLMSNNIRINLTLFQKKEVKPTIQFFHENKITTVIFEDVFFAFKSALEQFILGIRHNKVFTKKKNVLRCIEMIEKIKQNEPLPLDL